MLHNNFLGNGQLSIFDQVSLDSGFRLYALEVYNWGTFDKRVWTITPEGGNSLVTGENGSGKSTLFDALLTLLVRNKKRNYNLSSGAMRRERSEESYCLGAFGKNKDEYNKSVTCYLRDKKNYSVLIGNFKNNSSQQTISLCQFFWFEQGQLKKLYIIAHDFLSFKDHFCNLQGIADLKSRLKKQSQVYTFSAFIDYETYFRQVMGIRSEKALELFNQVVSIKDIDRLNQFIRQHMLEAIDMTPYLADLYSNYLNLSTAFEAIKAAREQLEHLSPLVEDGQKLRECYQYEKFLSETLQILPAFIAHKKIELLQRMIKEREVQLPALYGEIAEIERVRNDYFDRERRIESALANDQVGQEIKRLERDIQEAEKDKEFRKKNHLQFSEAVVALEKKVVDSEECFYQLLLSLEQLKTAIDKGKRQNDNQLFEVRRKKEKMQSELSAQQSELESLKSRKDLIPLEFIELRRHILKEIGAEVAAFPFIGELIKVKESEKKWEGACERLLRNFALRIVVPENYYSQFNKYVNSHHLRAKLVYQRAKATTMRSELPEDEDHLYHKLEFKADSPYFGWVQEEICKQFDFICTDNLKRLEKEARAITDKGLIKRNLSLHEKDDRHDIVDRRNYILGWSNLEKIATLEALCWDLKNQVVTLDKQMEKLIAIEEKNRAQEHAVKQILRFNSYDDVDWKKYALISENLTVKINDLKDQNQQIQKLKEELSLIKKLLKECEERRDLVKQKTVTLTNDIERDQIELTRHQRLLEESYHHVDYVKYFETPEKLLKKYQGEERPSLYSLDINRDKIYNYFSEKADKNKQSIERLISTLSTRMSNFINKYPGESENISVGKEYLDDFIALKEKIQQEALPTFETRFKNLLNDGVIKDMATFKSTLERHEEDIEASIKDLNSSLVNINYTPSTFIKINCIRGKDKEIMEFQYMLRDCLPDVGVKATELQNEESFHKIKKIISRMKEEDRWREKVIDVRNWLDYSAEEIYREDGSLKNYYSDSGGLSGGQKAKLAFTILASAISYQYGLFRHGSQDAKSFRLVIVDEAFSKSDDKNSQYAIDLFTSLGLQLMLITPKDKIHIVESLVQSIHLVQNNERLDNSTVHNISMLEYMKYKSPLVE
ncbi:MAG: hypothetical protein HQK52_18110 [Oligoflexia bacterium]|nr:hypothetical protein [Oligoflexia bacterium]